MALNSTSSWRKTWRSSIGARRHAPHLSASNAKRRECGGGCARPVREDARARPSSGAAGARQPWRKHGPRHERAEARDAARGVRCLSCRRGDEGLHCTHLPELVVLLNWRQLIEVATEHELNPPERRVAPARHARGRLEPVEVVCAEHGDLVHDEVRARPPARGCRRAPGGGDEASHARRVGHTHAGECVHRHAAHVARGEARGGRHEGRRSWQAPDDLVERARLARARRAREQDGPPAANVAKRLGLLEVEPHGAPRDAVRARVAHVRRAAEAAEARVVGAGVVGPWPRLPLERAERPSPLDLAARARHGRRLPRAHFQLCGARRGTAALVSIKAHECTRDAWDGGRTLC